MRAPRSRRAWLAIVPIAAVAAAVAVILVDSGADERPTGVPPGTELAPPESPTSSGDQAPAVEDQDDDSGPAERRAAIRAVRSYVRAIDDRDGSRVCSALAPGALDDFRLPRAGGGCAAAMSRSIGYRDPRGYPVFASARIDAIGDVAIAAGEARVTAAIVTEFADRDQPSIEDDLVYLVLVDGEWRVARPSAALYRAVGKPELPLEAVAPPG